MKKLLDFLCTLSPWLFFWGGKALGQAAWGSAAAIVWVAIFCAMGWHRMKGPDWTQLLFFTLVLLGLLLEPFAWAVNYQSILAPGLFVAMAFGSLLLGHPFTNQYAMDEIPAHFWNDPGFPMHFKRVNKVLTWLWGMVFALSLLCAWLGMNHVLTITWLLSALPALAFLLATILTRYFPPWYQKNYYEPTIMRPEMIAKSA